MKRVKTWARTNVSVSQLSFFSCSFLLFFWEGEYATEDSTFQNEGVCNIFQRGLWEGVSKELSNNNGYIIFFPTPDEIIYRCLSENVSLWILYPWRHVIFSSEFLLSLVAVWTASLSLSLTTHIYRVDVGWHKSRNHWTF